MSGICCKCLYLQRFQLMPFRYTSGLLQKSRCSTDTADTSNILKKDSKRLIEKTKQKLHSRKRKPTTNVTDQKLSEKSKEIAVPSSRISRMINYGTLAAGLGFGALNESVRKQLGVSSGTALYGNSFLTEANVERIVTTLCKVRGAALKFGQMMSIQDNSFVPDEVQKIFDRVRANADFMPQWQMQKVMTSEFGAEWKSKFKSLDNKPFAAASIGQVHRGTKLDGKTIAVKIQYPGVAESINSDIDTLLSILVLSKLLPEGLFLEQAADVARKELTWEVDYLREADCSARFKKLLEDDDEYYVADYIPELTTKRVLTTELMQGVPLDAVFDLDQETRNRVSTGILKLCLRELFEFNFMQTDPNWSNFLYNQHTDQLCLLDFGASREYSKSFVNAYINVIHGASIGDREIVSSGLTKLGFQTGYESKAFIQANIDAVMILGYPFAKNEIFDFGAQNIIVKIRDLIPVMLSHRLVPPPDETYSLHRKMSGAFLLCTKLGAKINCYNLFNDIWNLYQNT